MTEQQNLSKLIAEYAAVKAERMALEKKVADLKREKEDVLKQQILLEMAATGIRSMKLEGIGSVVAKSSDHYEIVDLEKLSRFMLQQMVQCAKEGRPLSDGILLQSRISRVNLEEYLGGLIDLEQADDAALAPYGIKLVSKPDLSITKR